MLQIAANSLDARTTSGSITLVDVDSQKEIAGGLTVTRAAAADAVAITASGNLTVLLATNSVLGIVYSFFAESENLLVKVPGIALYTCLMIVIGGFLGAFVFGVYWVLTSLLFGMHQDSFSALGIRHYKNFLRMKFEPDKLTIYPIALDKVPGRWGWRKRDLNRKEGSLIYPARPLKPRLIESPIEIVASTKFRQPEQMAPDSSSDQLA